MTVFWSSSLQSFGLLLDIIGAFLLFKYGIPSINRTNGAECLQLETENLETKKLEEHYDKLGKTGLRLLVLGFILQFIPNAISTITAWND